MGENRREHLRKLKGQLFQLLNNKERVPETVLSSLNLKGLFPRECHQTSQLVNLFKSVNEENDSLKNQEKEKLAKDKSSEEEYSQLSTKLSGIKEIAELKQQALEENHEKTRIARETVEKLRANIVQIKGSNDEIRNTIAKYEQCQENFEAQIAEKTGTNNKVAEELEKDRELLQAKKARNSELLDREKDEEKRFQKEQSHYQQLVADRNGTTRKLKEIEVNIKELEKQVQEYSQKLKRLHEKHSGVESDLRDKQDKEETAKAELIKKKRALTFSEKILVKRINHYKIMKALSIYWENQICRLNDPNNNDITMDSKTIDEVAENYRNIQRQSAERRAERKRLAETNDPSSPPAKQAKLAATTPASAPTTPIPMAASTSSVQRSASVGTVSPAPPAPLRNASSDESLVPAPATPELPPPSNNSSEKSTTVAAAAGELRADSSLAQRSRTEKQQQVQPQPHNPTQSVNPSARAQSSNHTSGPGYNSGSMNPPQDIHPNLIGHDYNMLGSRRQNRRAPPPPQLSKYNQQQSNRRNTNK